MLTLSDLVVLDGTAFEDVAFAVVVVVVVGVVVDAVVGVVVGGDVTDKTVVGATVDVGSSVVAVVASYFAVSVSVVGLNGSDGISSMESTPSVKERIGSDVVGVRG